MRKLVALTLLFTASLVAQSTILNNNGIKGTVAIRNATIVPVTCPIGSPPAEFAQTCWRRRYCNRWG